MRHMMKMMTSQMAKKAASSEQGLMVSSRPAT